MTGSDVSLLTFIAALAGGVGAGVVTAWLSIRWQRQLLEEQRNFDERRDHERRKAEERARIETAEIQVALAQILGGLAMQGTGEHTQQAGGKLTVKRGEERLRDLGVEVG